MKIKKIVFKIGMLAILAMVILPEIKVLAVDYTVLTALPDIPQGSTVTLARYIPLIFNLLIGLSAVWAVLMIVIGGFQYMSTDAIQGKANGKERIKNAVLALVFVIGAWLILNEINPNLLHINLNIEQVTATTAPTLPLGGELSAATGPILPGYDLTQAQIDKNAEMVTDLAANHVNVNNDPCTTADQTTGCTNLVGMPPVAYSGVKNLQEGCVLSDGFSSTSCGDVTITGGTEGGHASHGLNLPAMDLSYNNAALNEYIVSIATKPPEQTSLGPIYTVKLENGQNATFLLESNPPHWHAVFGGI